MAQTSPANSIKTEYDEPIAYKDTLPQLSQGAAFGPESLQQQQQSSSLSSSTPLPPAPQPQSRRTRETAAPLLLDPSMTEEFGLLPSKLQPSAIAYCAASPMVIPTSRSLSLSSSNQHHHLVYPRQQQQQQQQDTPESTLRQLPVLRSCTFVLLRVLVFPKTVFVKGVAIGRGCLSKIGVLHNPRHHRHRRHLSHHDPNDPHHNAHRRHHFRSYQHPSAPQLHFEGNSSRRARSASDSSSRANINSSSSSRHHYHRRRRSQSPPRDGHYHYSRNNSFLSTYRDTVLRRSCCTTFLSSYNVQVATICLCLTGEAFAQAVMCPFLYYMVRDFHVGADKWIGYYAGLLLTGFWGANLATTLFWGYLSDKYGRKAVMLFGLFMTSLSTVYLGLSTCYHDAMWALVIQGACTGLVPVSKCAIGELASRQQRIHNAEVTLVQQQQRQRLRRRRQRQQSTVEWEQGGFLNEKAMETRWRKDRMDDDDGREMGGQNHDHPFHGADPECEQGKTPVNAQHDFASKGYSALVIALALGAALGPLAGGILTKRMVPGFETYPYFAPCLLASAVGLFVTGVVALILNETHPKWASSSELEKTLENLSRFESMEGANDIGAADGVTRGRPGYENSRHYNEGQASAIVGKEVVASELNDQDVVASLSVGVTTTTTTSTGTRPRLRLAAGEGVGVGSGAGTITPPTVGCTCRLSESSSSSSLALPPPAYSRSNSTTHPRPQSSFSMLSPATELYLTLAIYTLLVLTSILGSEFVMLYTQSPNFRGGLEFSAKVLGQILTLRGIFKLGFTLCGYPWMVKRWGLLKCLRLGIVAIGTFSVVGLGWLVPWTIIAQHQENRASLSSDAVIGSSGEDALASNLPTNGSANIAGVGEKTPVGMGVILFCLSLVSMGDVLGYVSVLVLFGKSADRMKMAAASSVNNNNSNPIDSASCLENQTGAGTTQGSESGAQAASAGTQGGSGVLWSVAQVSGNVMRLTGPVIAGLLWSMVETSRAVTITDLHHVSNSSPSSSSSASSVTKPIEIPDSMYTLHPDPTRLSQSASASPSLSYIFGKWSSLSSSLPLLSSSWAYDEATTTTIFFGSTSVFYLIGVICLINFIACQYLIHSSSSSSSSSSTARSRVQSGSSGLVLGSGTVLSPSDEQTLRQLDQHQAAVTAIARLEGEGGERSYSIGHPRVNTSYCALHRAPMQTV